MELTNGVETFYRKRADGLTAYKYLSVVMASVTFYVNADPYIAVITAENIISVAGRIHQ